MRSKGQLFLFVGLISLLASSLIGCSGAEETKVRYVNEQYGYSIEYPRGWVLDESDPAAVYLSPKNEKYNQINIHASHGEPVLDLLSKSQFTLLNKAWLQSRLAALGGGDLKVSVNEPTLGKWDWTVRYTFSLQGKLLRGVWVLRETSSTAYDLGIIESSEWPEGHEVMDSFEVLD